MEVLIGWTGSPASSPHLVSEVKRLKSDPSFYGRFLDQSHTCVENLIYAFKTNNIKGVQKMIRQNRMIIQQMDNEATVDIETENLKMLCDIGERYGAAAKTSGVAVAIAVSPLLIIALIKIVFIMNGHHMVLNR